MPENIDTQPQEQYKQATDIIRKFQSEIYPAIEQQYSPDITVEVLKSKSQLTNILKIFSKSQPKVDIKRSKFELSMQTIKGIVEYVLWQDLDDQSKNQLLLEVIRLDVQWDCYDYGTIYYSKAATHYLSTEHSRIVNNCLNICDHKFFQQSDQLIYEVTHKDS